MKILKTYSSRETQKFAEALARLIVDRKANRPIVAKKATTPEWLLPRKPLLNLSLRKTAGKSALIFALMGELGSGKTTFVQGFLRGLGIRRRSPSPTFILFRRFAIRHLPFANLYHVDAYRIKNPRELLALGIKEIFSDPKNIVLVEWADKLRRVLPKGAIRIKFSHGKRENERTLTF